MRVTAILAIAVETGLRLWVVLVLVQLLPCAAHLILGLVVCDGGLVRLETSSWAAGGWGGQGCQHPCV